MLIMVVTTGFMVSGARIHVNIASPGFTKLRVAMPMFSGPSGLASSLWKLTRKDIEISGAFELINPDAYLHQGPLSSIAPGTLKDWNLIGADFVMVGKVDLNDEDVMLKVTLVETSTTNKVVDKTYTCKKEELYKAVHGLMDDFLEESIGLKGIFSTRIVCVADNGRSKQLYICYPDGSGGYLLEGLGRLVLDPAWSPDGSKIAFVSYKRNNPDIYIVDLKAKATRLVLSFPGLNTTPAFYPDGKSIAFTLSKDGNPEIYMMSLYASSMSRLTHNWATDTSPCFSPDGKKMVFCSNRGGSPQVYIKNMSKGNVTRLTFKGSYNTEPVFSPRGDWIAFSHLAADGHFHLAIIREDGTDMVVLKGTGKGDESPSFSPDGRLIVFASSDGNLYITDITGGTLVRITDGKYIYSEPSWQD